MALVADLIFVVNQNTIVINIKIKEDSVTIR